MTWFNTDWNLGNMFNSPYGGNDTSNNPYGFTGGGGGRAITPWTNTVTGETWNAPSTGYQPPNSDWQMVGGNKTNNLGVQNSVWGAPAYYQKQSTGLWGNNPYQAQGGGFYNPYQFGQVDYPSQYGTQYGGSTDAVPWWMNYNTNNSIINNSLPNNIPNNTPAQSDPSAIRRPQGTGPNGKDLTYDETIKYFGLYDNAEKAFAAGDSQAAYRKDHMHWRAGTGYWAGKGKQEGQSDLDYPGRKVGDNTIMGDRDKLGAWSNMGNNIQNYFKQKQMFNVTANDQGGNDVTVKDDGTLTTNDGTIIETQVMSPEEKAAQDLMLKQQDLDLRNRRNIFFGNYFSGRGPHYGGEINPAGGGIIQPTAESNINKNIFTPKNSDVPFISDYSADSRFKPANATNADIINRGLLIPPMLKAGNNLPFGPNTIPYGPQNMVGVVNDNVVNNDQLIMSGPFSPEEQLLRDEAEQRRYALTDGKINARWESEQIKKNLRQQTIDNDPFIRKLVDDGMLSMDQVPFSQISPYGKTVDGMTQPVSDEELNIFSGNNKDAYLNNLKAAVEEYGDFQSMGYTLQDLETTPGLKDWFKIHKRNKDNNQLELEAAAAKSKAEAEAYEAEQNRIRQAALEAQRVQAAQAKAQAEAQARAKAQAEAQARAKAAAAEKERQAAAAQKRMNDRYETGPVARAPTPAARPSAPAGGYSTKQRNNNFAVRRDIRNIFA